MSTHDRDELTRPQLKEVTGLAKIMIDAADELLAISTRRHPELHQVTWLVRQTHTRIHEILTNLGVNL